MKSYHWSTALILLPVIVLAGLAALGLTSQRKAVRSDAQQQAQQIARQLATKFQTELISRARYNTQATQGMFLPVPPAKVSPLVTSLQSAMAAKDRTALEKLASVQTNTQYTASGLPVPILAALAALELGPPIAPEVGDVSHALYPPNLLSQAWLEKFEAVATALPMPAPGTISVKDFTNPTFITLTNAAHARNTWDHDQRVRQAFWDDTKATWIHTTPGPYFINGEVFWITRYCPPNQPSAEPFPADPKNDPVAKTGKNPPYPNSLCVLTQDELASTIRRDFSQIFPAWIGFHVTMNGQPMPSVAIHSHMHCSINGGSAGQHHPETNTFTDKINYRKIVYPPQEDEWLDPAPTGEILASADGHFTVTATLKHPEILFAPTDRLTTWVTLLLASSVLAAGLGVWVIKRNLDRERRLNELKSQFVSSVSHELRAPVGSIRLMADALAQGTVTGAEADDFHRLMAQEGTRLSSLIENVLDFARIEQNRKTYTLEETDIATLVSDTVQLMTPQAKARQLTIQTDLQPPTQVPHLDAPAIQQALVNLLDNAIKFSPPNETIHVMLQENLPQHNWTLTVQDHGPGIPENEQEKIFERFYRLGNELQRETQGTGIGLSLVKHIVEGHGGNIKVSNDHGTVFSMVFPVPGRV